MKREELLPALRDLEARLRTAEVQAAYAGRSELERRRFVAQRAELSLLIARLTTAELESVGAKLDELERDLKRATAETRSTLAALDRPAVALNALSRLLGLLARIAILS